MYTQYTNNCLFRRHSTQTFWPQESGICKVLTSGVRNLKKKWLKYVSYCTVYIPPRQNVNKLWATENVLLDMPHKVESNWVFRPQNGVILWHFKFRSFDRKEFTVWNLYSLPHKVCGKDSIPLTDIWCSYHNNEYYSLKLSLQDCFSARNQCTV